MRKSPILFGPAGRIPPPIPARGPVPGRAVLFRAVPFRSVPFRFATLRREFQRRRALRYVEFLWIRTRR